MLLLSSRQDLTDVRPQEYIAYGLEACEYSSILNDSSYQSLASCVVTVDLFIFLKWPRSHRCCLHVAEYWSTQGHACQYFTSTAESWCKCTEVVVMKRLYSESGLFSSAGLVQCLLCGLMRMMAPFPSDNASKIAWTHVLRVPEWSRWHVALGRHE